MPTTLEHLDADLQSLLVQVWFHGLYTLVFLASLAGFFSKQQKNQNNRWLLASVTILMYLLSTIYLATIWHVRRGVFVYDFGSDTQVDKKLSTLPFYAEFLVVITFSANILIADCLFIWRSWIIWGRNWLAIVPAVILTVAGTVFSVLADYAQIRNSLHLSSVQNGSLFVNSGTVFLSMSFATTSLVTLLITGRIFWIHYQTRSILGDNYEAHRSSGKNGSYLNTIEIVVESSALYAIAELALLVLLVRGNINYLFAQGIVAQVTGMAPTLILARISLGYARPSTDWIRSEPELRFATSPGSAASFTKPSAVPSWDQLPSIEVLSTRSSSEV